MMLGDVSMDDIFLFRMLLLQVTGVAVVVVLCCNE
jgi:hypothetical protein